MAVAKALGVSKEELLNERRWRLKGYVTPARGLQQQIQQVEQLPLPLPRNRQEFVMEIMDTIIQQAICGQALGR